MRVRPAAAILPAMVSSMNIAEIGALVGDPGRANMLEAMFDGRALTAGELACIAGVSAATASGHLAKLVQGRLVSVESQGRHRYFRLASAEVAHMLETIGATVEAPPERRRATPRVPAHLREARACYDHLAGRLGVALADGLTARGAILLDGEGARVTEDGRALFDRLGVASEPQPGSRRPVCRACLDWSERRPHLAGVVGQGLLDRSLDLGWVKRGRAPREIVITDAGRRRFREDLGAAI
jgi:DNA-binding transcriptional ArsR family regulator